MTKVPDAGALMDNENQAEPEPDRGLIIEGVEGDAQVDVVAIHGLGGGRRKSWTLEADADECWLPTVFPGRVMLYGYDTSIESLPCKRRHIIREAKQFLQSLRERRDGDELFNRPIILVSHGLGGLIVKAAIVIASRDPIAYDYLLSAVRVLVFYDFPHMPTSTGHLEMQLKTHISETTGINFDAKSLHEMSRYLAEVIEEVNGMFIQSKITVQARIVNYFSHLPFAGPGFKAFGSKVAVMRSCFGFNRSVDRGHSSITRLNYDEVNKLRSEAEKWIEKGPSRDNALAIRYFASQASPMFPPAVSETTTPLIADMQKLLAADCSTVLHIQSAYDDHSWFEGISSYLYSEGSHTVVNFQFHDWDTRFSSIDNMLRTIISQQLYEEIAEETTDTLAAYLTRFSVMGTGDLLYYLGRVIPSDISTIGPIVYVLDGLDKCAQGASEFLACLNFLLRSEAHRFKFVIRTSLGPSNDILSEFARMPSDLLISSVLMQKEGRSNISSPQLFRDRTGFDSETLGIIEELENATSDDSSLLSLLQNWLDLDSRALTAVEGDLQKLKGPSSGRIFAALLSEMPQERRTWASTILLWVSLAFRPLLAEELCLVSYALRRSTSEDPRPDTYQQILGYFNGILQDYHGEVRFGHPEIRKWLNSNAAELQPSLSSTRAWWQQIQGEEKGHAQILNTCLDYLIRPHESHYFTDWPTGHPFPYAVEYWPSHYKMTGKGPEIVVARTMAATLLQDEALRLQWIRSYASRASHSTFTDLAALDPVAIAANIGLEDLVDTLAGGNPGNSTGQAVSMTMVEAAKSGNINLVRRLLPAPSTRFRLEDPKLESLVRAAVTSGCSDIVDEIVNRMPDSRTEGLELPLWTSDILFLAVWTDHKALARSLLDLGTDPHASFETNTLLGPVGLATMRNATSIISLLIERGYDITPGTGIEKPSLISTLAAWGSPEVIRLLLGNGIGPKSLTPWGETILEYSAKWGRYEVIDTLLELTELGQYLRDGSGHPLNITARSGYPKSTQVLMKHVEDPNVIDERGNTLKCAILSGNWQICQQLLEHPKIDVNNTGSDDKAPLLIAIGEKWQKDVVRGLLDCGADIEVKEPADWNRTCLLIASANSSADIGEVIRILLEHGADVTARDSDGWTPLFTAATFATREVVQQLIDAGSDVSAACGSNNLTPLHAAASRPEVLPALLAQGLDPSFKGTAEYSPLELAASLSAPEAVRMMLEAAPENKLVLSTSLRQAILNNNEESARMLLDAGADVGYTDSDKLPLLSSAVYGGYDAIVRMLLEFRPDVNAKDIDGESVLHHVNNQTSVAVTKLLVNAGAKLDATDKRGNTPLIDVINSGNWDVFRYLLSKKEARLTLNVAGQHGAALHRVCRSEISNNLELIQLLVDNGADVNLDCAGDRIGTPLFQCCVRGGDNYAPEKEEMVRYLVEKNAKVDSVHDTASPIHFASMCCSVNIIKILIAKGANPEAVDHVHRKPLHLACYNSLAAVEALATIVVEQGEYSSPNAALGNGFDLKDVFGRVPLHYAVATGDIALITFVLERSLAAGLTVDVVDYDGWTPLMWTVRDADIYEWSDDGRDRRVGEVVRLLLDRGADPAVRGRVPAIMDATANEWTAADVAQYHRTSSEVIELLEQGCSQIPGRSRSSKIGAPIESGTYCDGCELKLCGIFHTCQNCADFILCFKCFGFCEKFHPPHDFVQGGSNNEVDEQKLEAGSVASLPLSAQGASNNGGGDDLDLNSDVISDDDAS